MGSRISFSVFDADGLKTDLVPADFKVFKDGTELTSVDVTNNNDGTYYFPISATGKYTITVKNTNQDELKDIYMVTDDIVRQIDVDGTTIEYDSGLKVIEDVFSLSEHDHDAEYSDILHVHITEGPDLDLFFDTGNNNAITLSERAALSDTILDLSLSLAQNIANLSAAVINLQQSLAADGTGILKYRQVGSYFNYANTAPGDTETDNRIALAWTETSTTYVMKLGVAFIKRPGDTEVTILLSGGMSAGTGYVRMNTGAGAVLTDENIITNTGTEGTTLTIDISEETNRSHEIQIWMRSGNVANTLTMQLVAIEVR